MKKTVFALGLIGIISLSSCTKEDSCIGRSSDGTKLFEVEGSDLCNDQVNSEEGEYCDCSNQE